MHGRIVALLLASSAVAASAVFGCGKLGSSGFPGSSGGSTSSSTVAPRPAEPSPKVRITSPARGSFLAVGMAAVAGNVTGVNGDPIASVELMGQPVALDQTGGFRAMVNIVEGLNVLEATCTDTKGRFGSTAVGVLGGSYKPAAQSIAHAGLARVNDAALDAMGRLGEAGIWQTDWTTLLKGLNPLYDTNFLWIQVWVDIQQLRFRDVTVSIDSRVGGAFATIDVQQPILDVTVIADLGLGRVGPVPAVVQADSGRVTSYASLAARPDGTIATSTWSPTLTFQNFTMSVPNGGILDIAVQLLVKNAIQNALRSWVTDLLLHKLPPFLDASLAKVLQQQTPFDLLGKPYAMDIRAEQIVFDDAGLSLSCSFNAHGGTPTARALAAPGSLTTAGAPPPTVPNRGFSACADDDGFNRALYAMWAGGIMDVEIDDAFLAAHQITLPLRLEAGQLRRFLPEIGGIIPDSAPVRMRTEVGLPPVARVTGSPDLAVLQGGEIAVEFFVDRGHGWEKLLKAIVQAEMGIGIGFTGQGLEVSSVATPHFRFDLVEEPLVELDDRRLEVLLSVMLTPTVPYLLNQMKVIQIPHLATLTTFNVDVYQDGPAHDRIAVAGDMSR